MNKLPKILFVIILLAGIFIAFKLIGPAAQKPEDGFLYVKTGTTMEQLKQQLTEEAILPGLTWFNIAEKFLSFDEVKPGKYKIDAGMSVVSLLRMLRNGSQTPVSFVITKLRTREQLAGKMGRAFEFDSTEAIRFLNNNDSLAQYGLDTNTVMGAVLPLTYENKWNTTPEAVFSKFNDAYKSFWTAERKQKAAGKGLSIQQVITLASIVDEETNAAKEKGTIASVYMNRIAKGMPLQADPTVKFALKDFTIKRVLFKHLATPSPFNTYRNKGLPPGPICTPQEATLDAVLDAPKTEYIYFVASPAFDGTHDFSTNYEDHVKLARLYQEALNQRFGKIQDSTKK
ncbi:endolytic transglycosylase MltG [Niabella hibiscisoli]|uniref:endolytic transglycosylase MltG n=1 Tax=Niabella hibiscisoli TaxID=1825928 RepID=UPI001F0DFC79|nr:endolytic transglycosylase MltG [Niabella hibiscisoli]MCH5720352.1 endolytic transglycosylase MltG [Niabella hibiscisoli]